MNDRIKTSQKFSIHLDRAGRIGLVMAAHLMHGHVNRKTLMAIYGITQIQAGALIRDFIETHPSNIEWVAKHAHYTYSEKRKLPI